MKRILSMMAVAAMFFGMIAAVSVFADEKDNDTTEAVTDISDDAQEAMEVIESIVGEKLFFEEMTSRGEFVNAVAQALNLTAAEREDYFFSDVKSFSEYKNGVYALYDRGWVSKGESFDAESKITRNEAMKILVSAVGYGVMAKYEGGYPWGYIKIAKRLDLTDGLKNGELLDYADAYLLLYNAMRAPVAELTAVGKDKNYKETGETLFSLTYQIYETEGIVSRTPYNSLDGEENIGRGNTLEVAGEFFKCKDCPYDVLGTKCKVIYQKSRLNDESAVIYLRNLSEIRMIDFRDFIAKDGNTIRYWREDGKEKRLSLSGVCNFIYNGRIVKEDILDTIFAPGIGELMLKDNDGDSSYDVAYVNRYTYMEVLSYDEIDEIIRDKNSGESNLKIYDTAAVFLNTEEETIEPDELKEGAVLIVLCSRDNGFIWAKEIKNTVQGSISKIESDSITIDGVKYDISEYFRQNFLNQCQTLKSGIFHTDDNGILVSAAFSTEEILYGYLIDAAWQNSLDSKLLMKIYNQSGKHEVYPVRSKLTVDGVEAKTDRDAFEAITENSCVVPQLIRFGINEKTGEINLLDTATVAYPEKLGIYPNEKNKLTKYLSSVSLPYNSNIGAFSSYGHLVSTIVFCIPDDLSKSEDFSINSRNFFLHDQSYIVDCYDLDETGGIGAVVYKSNEHYRFNPDDPSAVIEDVAIGMDDNGEKCYILNCWYSGKFIELRLNDDITVEKIHSGGTPVKSAHPILSSGDIIRYVANEKNEIRLLDVVFDASQGVFEPNNGSFNSDIRRSPMYFSGKIYSMGNGFAALSASLLTEDEYNFSPEVLKYISMRTSNIALYDGEKGVVRPIDAKEIKTYMNDGSDAYFAVFCQSNYATKTIVLYERMEGRK